MRGTSPVNSPMSGNSSPALINGWALNVCSINVVPERGKPTMKMGWAMSDRTPARGRICEPRSDEKVGQAPRERRGFPPKIALARHRAQQPFALGERRERLCVSAHPIEQKPLLAPLDGPQTPALAPLFDFVERGQRLVVSLDAAIKDRALQQHVRASRRQSVRGVKELGGSPEVAVGLLHARPAVESLDDCRVKPSGLLV